jgi:hypothetical protein
MGGFDPGVSGGESMLDDVDLRVGSVVRDNADPAQDGLCTQGLGELIPDQSIWCSKQDGAVGGYQQRDEP